MINFGSYFSKWRRCWWYVFNIRWRPKLIIIFYSISGPLSHTVITINIFNVLLCLCVFHQIKYAGADTDFSASPAFYKQISRVECEEQRVIGTQTPLQQLLEGLIADKELPAKDKRKRLKQVCLHTKAVIRARFNGICLIRFWGESQAVLKQQITSIYVKSIWILRMRQNQFAPETAKDVIALYSFSCSTPVAIDAVSTGEDANVKQHGTVRCRNRSVGTFLCLIIFCIRVRWSGTSYIQLKAADVTELLAKKKVTPQL